MNKRFFSLLLCFSLVFVFLLIPFSASAAEADSELQKIDVLSYDYPDSATSARVVMKSDRPYNVFNLPFSYGLYYFDVIFECPVSVSSVGVRSLSSGSVYSLTLASLGSNKYRAYGSTSLAFNSAEFAFQIVASSSSYSITYYKFDVYTTINVGVGDLGEMNITSVNGTTVWFRQNSPGVPITEDFYYFSASETYNYFKVQFSSVNWRKYDYLDFSFSIDCANIQSIVAFVLTPEGTRRYLSFDISYLDSGVIDKNEYIDSGGVYAVPSYSFYDIMMRLYIPSEYRSSGSLYIVVDGKYYAAGSKSSLKSVMGYYYTSVPQPDLVKLDQITQAIKESLSSSASQNQAANDFKNEVVSSGGNIASDSQVIADYEKPSAAEVFDAVNPSNLIDDNSMSLLVSMYNPITHDSFVLGILVLVASVSLIGLIFFGRK